MFTSGKTWIWSHEPEHRWHDDALTLKTQSGTDFWQGTHYGFRRDDGHCLLTDVEQDFSLVVRCSFTPANRYDQGGVMVRIDAENWIKIGIEAESKSVSRLGSVVTNLGYSDWATQDIDAAIRRMWYRVQGKGPDVLIECSETGKSWNQMRITHLHAYPGRLSIGVYACSPSQGDGCEVTFDHLHIGERLWEDE
ncbi:MAG: DUF1349 domain-containing protein [Sphaerochaetaceae bacterium]|nr:DUF1349 domain-containing protein [Sphaerochaetaceae bacterium]MDX9940298.1 DUF1349 domain-containing protein [Sphaerochaetaceae bacterium]